MLITVLAKKCGDSSYESGDTCVVLKSYRPLLSVPYLVGLFVWSLIARLNIAALPIGTPRSRLDRISLAEQHMRHGAAVAAARARC